MTNLSVSSKMLLPRQLQIFSLSLNQNMLHKKSINSSTKLLHNRILHLTSSFTLQIPCSTHRQSRLTALTLTQRLVLRLQTLDFVHHCRRL